MEGDCPKERPAFLVFPSVSVPSGIPPSFVTFVTVLTLGSAVGVHALSPPCPLSRPLVPI